MKSQLIDRPAWVTASFGSEVNALPPEQSSLVRHLTSCQRSQGRFFAFRRVAESAHGFLSARFVTTLVALMLLMAVVVLVY
jgi:hypothetical protein